MITAEHARKLQSSKPLWHEIETIEKEITKAAAKGKTNIWHYKQLSPQMKDHLAVHGYKIKEQFDCNEYLVNISWAD